jgi:hypothetical protein
MGVRFFLSFCDGVDGKKKLLLCVSPFSSGADACGKKKKKR